MSDRKLNVTAFGAHPDDIEGRMAGTLIKYREQGHRVHMVIATDGRRGGAKPGEALAARRKKEAVAAAAYIGIEPVFLGFEDGRVVYDRPSYEKVLEAFELTRPDIVITHDPNDYHADHRTLSRMVTDASWVPVFFSDTCMGVGFSPEFYVDITSEFDLKIKMLREHVSQHGEKPLESKYVEEITILARLRGMQCLKEQIRYAEAFRLYPRCGWVDAYELLPKQELPS